jgi:triacylglycerol lipase
MAVTRIYLSAGLFGFHQIGAYAYFKHFERALLDRFRDAGCEARVHRVGSFPTASMRKRARTLADEIDRTAAKDDPVHIVGHSTGGLDARLVAAPSTVLGDGQGPPAARWNLKSITTMNTPHYGTPLAGFFATVSGQRLLYALSALTVIALKLGAPPLAITSSIVATFGRLDRVFGLEVGLLEKLTETIVRTLDDASGHDLRIYLGRLSDDQGGILQLSPESMDIFQCSVEDNPNVYYQSTASYAPEPTVLNWARSLASPWTSPSATVFASLYRLTAMQSRNYTCGPVSAAAWDAALIALVGQVPPVGANDGVVPFRSQLYGKLVWAGQGDHLDVVGHFSGGKVAPEHNDWLASGARFDKVRWDALVDAIAKGILEGTPSSRRGARPAGPTAT